jgi:hypothetical protein
MHIFRHIYVYLHNIHVCVRLQIPTTDNPVPSFLEIMMSLPDRYECVLENVWVCVCVCFYVCIYTYAYAYVYPAH